MEEVKSGKVKIPLSKNNFYTVIIIIAVAVFIFTGLYTVGPEEVGVIRRFGKYYDTTGPGLHFKIPFGVDNLTKVKTKRIHKMEFGFRTREAGIKTRYSSRDFSDESLMLTGDLNIADVEWVVQFRINDAPKFLFNVRNIEGTIRNLSEAAMRLVVGDHSVDEVISLSRQDINYQVREILQENLDVYNAGIEVVKVFLQNATPPKKVQPAFNDVNSAEQEQERIINDAWKQYNNVIPEARGKAKRTIEEAAGYKIDRINRAKGDAKRFTEIWNEYKKAKTVTRKRLYIETMQKVLKDMDEIYIVDEKQKGMLPLLNIGKGGAK
ncbi:MAG: FtsH protease activity modulator HflK [Candidatus Cloacimonadota bacterium]|nr:MAG: FtsH protease activity modulator HflK [Candidatus Cloacimonadota bacterium]